MIVLKNIPIILFSLIICSRTLAVEPRTKPAVQVEAGEFEVLSVKFGGFWIWWQKPQFKIKGDGSAEFFMNKGPKDTTRYRTTFNLSKEHLRQLNELLKKTGWLTKPGANEEPKYTDASWIDITLVRKSEVKKVWCHDRNPEPYLSLVNFLKRIHRQEYLLNRMTAAAERERIDAFREINQELRAAEGDPVVAHPTPVLDYHRLLPVCKEVITHTDDNHRDVIVTALKLLGLLRVESERDTITELTTAKQTSSKPEWTKSKTERVRSAAINSLVKFGGEESRQHLRKIAPNHRNFDHRVNDAIVAGLLELDGERSIELLKDMASTTRVAAWALIRLGPASVPTIVEILERPYNAHDSGPSNVIRAYIDHWDELPVLVDPRVVASVRRRMPVRSSWAVYRYHGRLLWLASLAHCKASRLEFRIAPVPAELGRPPGIAEMTFAGYRADLAANGPVSDPEFAGFWQWFELRTQAPELSYVGTYNGRKYALLCALPPHAMFADVQGPGTWGLKKVYATTDSEGRLAIGFELDENGAKLFAQLTKNNVGNHLAILVDSKVLSIVKVTSALPEKGVIAGSFAQEDIDNIVTALRKGMQPAKPDVQVDDGSNAS